MNVTQTRRTLACIGRNRQARRAQLTIIIVNHESWPDVSAHRVADRRARIRVGPVSDRGRRQCLAAARARGVSVSPIRSATGAQPENWGFAAGVNAGWRVARSPWLLVLNPDVEVAKGFLGQVCTQLDQYEANPHGPPGIVGFGLANPDGSPQGSVGVFPNLARTIWEQFIPRSRRKYQAGWRIRSGPVDWVTGACMLVNSEMIAALGGMDEDFFLYYEEVAFSRAAQRLGWRVEYDASVVGGAPTSLAKSADFAQDAGHHPAQQAALFPQALAALAVCRFMCDRPIRSRDSRFLGKGPEAAGRTVRVANDRRDCASHAGRGCRAGP